MEINDCIIRLSNNTSPFIDILTSSIGKVSLDNVKIFNTNETKEYVTLIKGGSIGKVSLHLNKVKTVGEISSFNGTLSTSNLYIGTIYIEEVIVTDCFLPYCVIRY